MKKFLICVILVLITVMAFGQKPRLVVPPFENRRTSLNNLELENMQDFLINAFINNGTYDVPDRSALATIAAEHNFQLSDWSDDSKSAEMGRVLNANYIVRVIVLNDGRTNIFMARILDVNTATGLTAGEMEFTNQSDARAKMPDFVSEIMRRIPQGTRTTGGGNTASRTYQIGDRGPAGGYIFYDKGVFSNGWRYLEAAPEETEFRAVWGVRGQNVANTGTGVGTGKRNTQLIVELMNRRGVRDTAAQLCLSLDFNGFTDWFLPSRDELTLISRHLTSRNIGGFSIDRSYYWSSSQFNSNNAFFQVLSVPTNAFDSKLKIYLVRAVRQF
ncbi:MAG: hypothetical protein FWD28_07090 [Treponema sp.]|nr:hypothetical protein [Treponema sp.]